MAQYETMFVNMAKEHSNGWVYNSLIGAKEEAHKLLAKAITFKRAS